MKNIRQIHRNAMELAQKAALALNAGDSALYIKLAEQALSLEREASLELLTDFDAEPTRSVLFRSAASLAYNIGNYAEAKKLAHLALAGNPFDEIKDELNELLENAEAAILIKAPKDFGLENAYLESLRDKAVNIKLSPADSRYSKAVVLDYIVEFLRNFQSCFSNFSEINFRKLFTPNDFYDFDKVLNIFKHDTKALAVGFKFSSFGISVALDTNVVNYKDIASPKFKVFKDSLFNDFNEEILMADFNNPTYQKTIKSKYSEEERVKIFAPIVDSLKEKSKYRISVVEKDFKTTIKDVPSLNSKAIEALRPTIKTKLIETDDEVYLKRTLEVTNSAGQKVEKILSEQLEYAEFKIPLQNLEDEGKEAFFINTYEQKVIFNRGVFLIDDETYKIYVEGENFKEVENLFARELISKFSGLLDKENLLAKENESLPEDELRLLETFKSTILKGW